MLGTMELSCFPHCNQVYVILSQIWHLFINPRVQKAQPPYGVSKSATALRSFLFQKCILCFCAKYQHFFWKVLLLSFNILFLPTIYFHSAFVRSFMTFIWSLQRNLLPSQTKSKSKAILRRPRWMKLQYNCIMLRIMIPLQVSMEIRSTSLQCRIFILLTLLIDFQCSNPVLLKYPPHQLQNVNTGYEIFNLFYHQILFN